MNDYKEIFNIAQQLSKEVDYKETFPIFHQHPELFHFIMAPEYQYTPDIESLNKAYSINKGYTQYLVDKGPSKLGGGSDTLDGVESRHILTIVFLLESLGSNWKNVIEIGGGYGNYLRLAQGMISYDQWTIIDLDYILELQKWFQINSGLDLSKVNFIDTEDISTQLKLSPDLIIGIHSLSEISLEDFSNYYFNIMQKAKHVFYISQLNLPSQEILIAKLNLLLRDFEILQTMAYEGGTSIMFLLKHR